MIEICRSYPTAPCPNQKMPEWTLRFIADMKRVIGSSWICAWWFGRQDRVFIRPYYTQTLRLNSVSFRWWPRQWFYPTEHEKFEVPNNDNKYCTYGNVSYPLKEKQYPQECANNRRLRWSCGLKIWIGSSSFRPGHWVCLCDPAWPGGQGSFQLSSCVWTVFLSGGARRCYPQNTINTAPKIPSSISSQTGSGFGPGHRVKRKWPDYSSRLRIVFDHWVIWSQSLVWSFGSIG